jgi:CHAT domain-containing protein
LNFLCLLSEKGVAQGAKEDTLLLLKYDSIGYELYQQNQIEESNEYLKKIIEIAERQRWYDVWAEYMLNLRIIESFAGNYAIANEIFLELKEKENAGLLQDEGIRQQIYQHYAAFLHEFGDLQGAQDQLDQLQQLKNKLGVSTKELTVTGLLAVKTGQYNKAIHLANEELKNHELRKATYPGPQEHFEFRKVALQKNLGQAYLAARLFDPAKSWLEKGQIGFSTLHPDFKPKALEQSILGSLSELSAKRGDLTSAKSDQLKRIEILESDNQINLVERIKAYTAMIRITTDRGELDEAQQWVEKANSQILAKSFNTSDFPGVLAANLALLQVLGKENEAEKLIKKHLKQPIHQLPQDPRGQAELLLEVANQATPKESLKLWMDFYDFLANVSQRIGVSFLPPMEDILQKANSLSIGAMHAAFDQSADGQYWVAALKVIEFNLAFETNTALIPEASQLDFGIDPRIIKEEKDLRSKILLQQYILKSTPSQEKEAALLELFYQQDSLNQVILNQFPEYYRFRYSYGGEELGKLTESRDNFLTYFYNDAFIYRIGKNGRKLFFDPIPIQNLDQNLAEFSQALSFPDNSKKHLALGAKLYPSLLGDLMNGTSSFWLIPYGKIQMIPFHALNSNPQGDFLVAKHRVSYQPTIGSLLNQSSPTTRILPPTLQVFAPFYSNDPGDLSRAGSGKLPGTSVEVTKLSKSFKINAFTGALAEKSQFIKVAASEKVIHLATHAFYPGERESPSWIAFNQNDSTKNLYSYEIYNLNLPLEFLGLSACKTGVGHFEAGRGVQSLGNAFSFAGVKSLAMSLWDVNDQSTSELMDYFYEELGKGREKDEALQLAQLRYLDANEGLRTHPYYWAGFIIQGENTGLSVQGIYIYLTIGICFTLILIWIILRKSKYR